ncbi:MAG: hypothetical protein M3Y08_19965, partial [Fibrobacterota bacterium]|nr:hypothetical protein [Fibrobacterota bacterium]
VAVRFIFRSWFFLLVLCCIFANGEAPLLICIPGGQPPGRIDSTLGRAISPHAIMAFQRVKDLDEVLSSYPGAPVISSAAYARYLPGYAILLRGRKGQEKKKKYLIISSNPAVTKNNAAAFRVGIVDFLGRDKLPAFVKDAFGISIVKLKRVSKKEDLLTLLGMESVDAAIIEESDLVEMRADTKMKLAVLLQSKAMDSYPVLASPDPVRCNELRMKLLAQPKAILHVLDIEGWE